MKKLILFILYSAASFGACSGSGLVWTCPAGATPTDVANMYSSATDGAVATFATGSYTWNTRFDFSLAKGITLLCGGTCTVSSNTIVFGWPSGNSTKLYRISGFTFNISSYLIWTCPAGSCIGTLTKLRLDHNTITESSADQVIVQIAENTAKQYVYGVLDHNTVNSASSTYFMEWINTQDNAPPAPPLGTVNNLFLEDNTISMTTITDLGTGCTDGWGQMAMVYRHNTSTNCRVITHGVTHGGGPSNVEDYNNTITETDHTNGLGCFRCIHHQGSNTFIAFNNGFTTTGTKDTDPIAFLHYCSLGSCIDGGLPICDGTQAEDGNRAPTATWKGYPCFRQPGRDVTGAYKPMYFWNNKWTDTGARIDANYDDPGTPTPDLSSFHMIENREYYVGGITAQSAPTVPFNGSTAVDGMGFGTLANRPATCTTSSETAFGNGAAGVGYFATDVGPQGPVGAGTLYTCSGTNTWTVYWTEYQYPHPLEGFSVYPGISPGAGSYVGSQIVTVSNPNASGVVCVTTNGTTPVSNNDGLSCATGTAFTGATSNITVATTQTVKAIAGTSTVSDSQVNQQPFTISGGGAVNTTPGLLLMGTN